jgi:hypothetical protein
VTLLLVIAAVCAAVWQVLPESIRTEPSPVPAVRAQAQANPIALSPSEAYKAALAPFVAAKAQPDDLTDADKFALGIGKTHASRDCLAISVDKSAFATDQKELIALSELCIFGEQYEPARATLVRYLALPEPAERKLALVLLVRALLGLGVADGAELQVRSLLQDYPYDAQIHFAIDQVIDAMEGSNSRNPMQALKVLQLCQRQNVVTLPLLSSGKALEGKDISASASVLFGDAVRCAGLAEPLGKTQAQNLASRDDKENPGSRLAEELRKVSAADETMPALAAIAQQPSWAGTADLAPMQAALARQQMVGARVPLSSLHGHVLSGSTLVPSTVLLTRGTVLLLPFTLWSPSAANVARAMTSFAPQQPVYAITSWSANTGGDDAPSKLILTALRMWQGTRPQHVSMLIVPDAELRAFHADSFPSGVVIMDGTVRSNSLLSSQGAVRMLVLALKDRNQKP